MEHHEAVYDQVIDINNSNQETEYISQQMHETVVQTDINQKSERDCVMTGLEILMPNDYICVQDQHNRNHVLQNSSISELIHKKQVENSVNQIKNSKENFTDYNQSDAESKIEQYSVQNSETYQETHGTEDPTIVTTNTENSNKKIITKNSVNTSKSDSRLKADESSTEFVHNLTVGNLDCLNNCRNKIDYFDETEKKQISENDSISIKKDAVDSLVTKENFKPISIDTAPLIDTVVIENITEEPYNKSQNHDLNVVQVQEIMYDNNSESEYNDASSKPLEISKHADQLIIKSVGGIKANSNSDDVAILSEFNSNIEFVQNDYKESEVLVNLEISSYNVGTLEPKHESKVETTEKDLTGNSTIEIKKKAMKSEDHVSSNQDIVEDNENLDLHLSLQSSENQRKVIQDIFDDWQDENCEEDNDRPDHQDSVELELQNLLNDEAQDISSGIVVPASSLDSLETYCLSDSRHESSLIKQKILKSENKTSTIKKSSNKSPKSNPNCSPKDQSFIKSKSQDHSELKQKLQSPRPGVKVPSHHLTSQIASTAEVTEALKERLREKQKDLIPPKTADLVFVKKITARLSSKLAGAVTNNVTSITLPALLNEEDGIKVDKTVESNKNSVSDNKELLAILEGDDDPDWIDAKSLTEESSKTLGSGESCGSKLNPVLEKELALKQLQELPCLPSKKMSPGASKKKKYISKSNQSDDKLEIVSSDEDKFKGKEVTLKDSDEEEEKDSLSEKITLKAHKENTNENIQNDSEKLNVEESRSGRKRKLTEKARQHELSFKRQKTVKGKIIETKKKECSEQLSNIDIINSELLCPEPSDDKLNFASSKIEFKSTETRHSKSIKSQLSSGDEQNLEVMCFEKNRPSKQLGVSKKDDPISKKKLAVKNLMRQKMVGKKTASKLKVQTEAMIKDSTATKTSIEKSTAGGLITRPKKSSEIDKLLQDEGVVNLLYDVEQPDSRRLVPITKSQKKIMDVDKAERELKLRTKLVRNAVMRLRNSNTPTMKISPRSRRSAVPMQISPHAEKKLSESAKLPKTSTFTVSPDFTLPGKMQRNAADASRIIRRHSSSSFSSASASPRVSVDMTPELLKADLQEIQTKTKKKALRSPDDPRMEKKNNKKNVLTMHKVQEDVKPKKESPKKWDSDTSTPTSKTTSKNKKSSKSKKALDPDISNTQSINPEKVTACLAEAACALSSFTSRLSSTCTNQRKGNASQIDNRKLDLANLSAYEEINVKQHGHLVQLILTPSTRTLGIRNALTIKIMKELTEALLILKQLNDCRVVLLTSTGTTFCEGLDVSFLVCSNKEDRRCRAEEMAKTVKDFIRTLSEFNKPIVAGVQGTAIGLGVTMLPLFDLVIASDKATFSTPYARLGQIAEGAAVLTLSHSLGTAVTNELLLGGRTLTASEALRAGLVTRVLWPDRFSSELLPSLKSMSEQSSQSMEATKALLRRSLRKQLGDELESETLLLIEHWYSSECQEAIQAYVDEKGQ